MSTQAERFREQPWWHSTVEVEFLLETPLTTAVDTYNHWAPLDSAVFVAATVISVKPPWKTQLVDFHLRFSRGLCEHTVHQDSRVGCQCLRILRIPRHWALRRTLLLLFCPHGSTPPLFIPMLRTFKKKVICTEWRIFLLYCGFGETEISCLFFWLPFQSNPNINSPLHKIDFPPLREG